MRCRQRFSLDLRLRDINLSLKSLLVSVILIFSSSVCQAQPGFLQTYDQSAEEAAVLLDMVRIKDTLVFYGVTGDELNQPNVGFYRLDTLGNLLQRVVISNPDTIWTSVGWARKKIISTSDGGFAIMGSAIGLDSNDLYLMRVDRNLDLVDIDYYLADQFMGNSSLMELEDGFLLAGHIRQQNNSLAANTLLIKVNEFGIEQWRKELGNIEYVEAPTSLIRLDSNKIQIGGGFSDYPDIDDDHWPSSTWGGPFIWIIDTAGNELSTWAGDTSYTATTLLKLLPLDDGGWMCTSLSWEPNPQGGFVGRPVLVRYDSDFNVVWEQVFGYVGAWHGFRDLERTHDGHFLASGFIATDRSRSPCAVHYKFSIDGDSIWMRGDTIYPNSRTIIQATEILSSGSIISIGYVSVGPFGETGFVIKLSPDGCLDTINCFPFSSTEDIIYSSDVLRIYPNPANEQISIDLPDRLTGPTTIIVRDIQGRIVREDVHTYATGSVNLHVAQLTAGQYFVEVLARGQSLYGRFVKL